MISLAKEPLDCPDFAGGCSSDLDLAAHREESPAAHEVPVEVEGWLWAGAIAPGSKAPESSEVTDVDAGLDCFDFDEAAPRSAPIAAKKAITAARSKAAFAPLARARAAAMREPLAGRARSEGRRAGEEADVLMATWNRANVRAD